MKINLKQKKYIFPLIFLPFIVLFFYVYKDLSKEEVIITDNKSLQENLSGPSKDVVEKTIKDKLSAYRENYKNADGYTAIGGLTDENKKEKDFENLYSNREKSRLDSLKEALKQKMNPALDRVDNRPSGFSTRSESLSEPDKELLALLNGGNKKETQHKPAGDKDDPLKMMRQQYALIDSFQKATDPAYQANKQKESLQKEMLEKQKKIRDQKISVNKTSALADSTFNTVRANQQGSFIKAIIDEGITGSSGSRIRIRILESIMAGNSLIPKGTYMYAVINGFSEQRVTFLISSIMLNGKILPVNLDVYDLDGLRGLYVPESAFRDFTREMGSSSLQGMNMSSSSSQDQSQFLMSGVQKMLQSTSQAVAKAINKNKAKIKYSTNIYLIDSQELENEKNNTTAQDYYATGETN